MVKRSAGKGAAKAAARGKKAPSAIERERHRLQQKKYYHANKDKRKQYREANKAKIKAWNRTYYQLHKDKLNTASVKRRAAKRNRDKRDKEEAEESSGGEASCNEESSLELRMRKRNANYDRLIALQDARKLQEAGEAAGQALALEPAEEAAWEGRPQGSRDKAQRRKRGRPRGSKSGRAQGTKRSDAKETRAPALCRDAKEGVPRAQGTKRSDAKESVPEAPRVGCMLHRMPVAFK